MPRQGEVREVRELERPKEANLDKKEAEARTL